MAFKSDEIVKRVSSEIVSRVNPNWSTLQKIRFVYVELGRYLEKNTDFFLNEKMTSGKMSREELLEIYQEDMVGISFRDDFKEQYQVICKSAAFFLKTIFDELGIESQYVWTLRDEGEIKHWFLAVKDDADDKYVFLTLAADLANIKNNFPTEHFATHITYQRDGIQYYDAPREIDHKVLTPEELEELDYSLGYTRFYPRLEGHQMNVDLDHRSYRDLYYRLLDEDTEIYHIFQENLHIQDDSFRNIDEITDDEFISFLQELESFIMSHIPEVVNVDFPYHDGERLEEYIRDAVLIMMRECDFSIDYNNQNLGKLVRNCKKKIPKSEHEYVEFLELIGFLVNIHTSVSDFIAIRRQYEMVKEKVRILEDRKIDTGNAEEFSEILKMEQEIRKRFEMSKKRISITSLNMVLNRLACYFVQDSLESYGDGYVSVSALSQKLQKMFPIVFDSYLEEEGKSQSSFSIQGYSEQIFVIKKLLRLIFAELKHSNSEGVANYNDQYAPVDNRIQTFPLKDRTTGEYCIGFNVTGREIDEEDSYYIFIPSLNTFRAFDYFVEGNTTYQIVSDRFSKKIEELEEERTK